jgi:RNA polymerase sigma factor (sigma-70 family)
LFRERRAPQHCCGVRIIGVFHESANGAAMFLMSAVDRDIQEGDLARSAARGLRAAQRDLFHRLAAPVHDILYHVLGTNEHMERLLEDAFVEIFRSLPAYDRKLDLSTWACAIAVRIACRHLESKRRDPHPASDRASGVVQCVGSPEGDPHPSVGCRQLYGLFRKLEPEQHVTLALFMMARRSIGEIAVLTNVGALVVRARLLRARRVLSAAARGDRGLMATIALHTKSH